MTINDSGQATQAGLLNNKTFDEGFETDALPT